MRSCQCDGNLDMQISQDKAATYCVRMRYEDVSLSIGVEYVLNCIVQHVGFRTVMRHTGEHVANQARTLAGSYSTLLLSRAGQQR